MPRLLLTIAMIAAASSACAEAQAERRPASFIDASTVAPGLMVEMRYFGSYNFVGRPIDGYETPVCLLTRQAAAALAQVVRDLAPQGLAVKVFDCYRPARAVANFVRWARDLADVARKSEFYPAVDKRNLFRDGYIAARSGHSRGSTMDLTLARRADGQGNAQELDMGTPFDFFSPRSWPSDRRVSEAAQRNRALLAQSMHHRGFVPYGKEWWHFTLRHEPFRHTYFDFSVR